MWAPLLDEVITKAIHFSGWTGPDGVNFEFEREETHKNAHVGERSLFIRGLFEARSHMDPDSPAARLIESYITIQVCIQIG
ncbi:hypothetical protein EW026_g1857 [Hermanssonia centrifuga]|uniref:Uncharacterized protein n=1 Tax=Hermanssonia centrifuga TaxID=98765 RepID=A0A4S4KR08_9APHY|nr:hypothetical protein EW026_g1857 [Hermanssonia centrifuga]